MALVVAAQKLRPYFHTYPVIVMTDQSWRQVLHKPEASGRLVKWSVELSKFDISYQPRVAIKAQALVDFVAECIEENKESGRGNRVDKEDSGGV